MLHSNNWFIFCYTQNYKYSTDASKDLVSFTPVYSISSDSCSFIFVIFSLTPVAPCCNKGVKIPLPTDTASAPNANALQASQLFVNCTYKEPNKTQKYKCTIIFSLLAFIVRRYIRTRNLHLRNTISTVYKCSLNGVAIP